MKAIQWFNLVWGKNMVRSIRFWATLSGVVEARGKEGFFPSKFGNSLLGVNGQDPYLEDIRTLWLIHWKLSTQISKPLFAWHFILNRWHQPEMSKTTAMSAFRSELVKYNSPPSETTLSHHFDVFIHSYVPTRGFGA